MDDRLNVPVLLATFAVSTLHTLLPSHWLCFVLVGRARGWSLRRTLAVAAGAGMCHVASTIVLGLAAIVAARELIDEKALTRLSAAILLGMGALYLLLHLLKAGHRHARDAAMADRAALVGLFAVLFFSPCEAVIPLFLVASVGNPALVAMMCGIVAVAGIGGVLLLVWVAYAGAQALRLELADRYEKLVVGLVLASLGGVVWALG